VPSFHVEVRSFLSVFLLIRPHVSSPRLQVLDNKMQRQIFTRKKVEVSEQCMILHNEELRNLHGPPTAARRVKSRRLQWDEHVDRRGRR
jgi:hypothetical protein